jgi:hypothetical protein
MNPEPFKPKAYIKDGCPFSFKFWLFMVEAGLAGQMQVIRCREDAPAFDELKRKLAAATGRDASFPTVEIAPGRYQSDSDALIEHFARNNGVDSNQLPALAFYRETIFPQVVELHQREKHG